jgi:hypothetical protein
MVVSPFQGFLFRQVTISLVTFLLGTITTIAQPKHLAKVTFLRVRASEFGYEQEVRVSADSGIVDIKAGEDHHTHYARAVTNEEYEELVAPFSNRYLSSFKDSYEAPSMIDDTMGFGIFIHKGEEVKYIGIHQYKLALMYLFSNRLNKLLPVAFRLPYTDSYFKN